MIDWIKEITELGSFGMIVALFIGVGYVGKRIVAILEHFAQSLEMSLLKTSDALAQMARDNAAHFAKDDVIQTQIAQDLERLIDSNTQEHATIRTMIEIHHGTVPKGPR
jgi:homoserine dehydrogenase